MKIALTADWHIRSKHLGVLRRGPDFTAAAASAVREAIKAGAVAILNGGDTFHDKRPTTTNIEDLQGIDEILREHSKFMYTIDGNHDGTDPSWLKTLFDTPSATGGIVDINNRRVEIKSGKEVVSVHGIPACDGESLKAQLETLAQLPDDVRPDIILWHGAIREMAGYPDPNTISIEDLPTGAFKAILCGDIHRRQFVVTGDGCLVGYPGATELSSRDEVTEERTVTIVDTSTTPYSYSYVPIQHRKAHTFQVYSVEQLEEVLQKLSALPKDPWPIVFVRYDAGVHPQVCERLYNAVDNPMAVLRAAPSPKMEAPMFSLRAEGIEVRTPADFVPKFFPHNNLLSQLARALCSPDADHRSLLDEYVDAQLSLIP